MSYNFSFIIPVYNRPEELKELLQSIVDLDFEPHFEVVVVEDGSTNKSDHIVEDYSHKLTIKYLYKENSGPGQSRNYGMKNATGDYYIILDSDCILPKKYLVEVHKELTRQFCDAFGGPDRSHESFTTIQKAINYAMTSVLTTGGLRGHKKVIDKFQLRSFNMGLSKKAFIETEGFAKQNFGEDIEFTFRLWSDNFKTRFFPKAFVYHKRRTSFKQFYNQVNNFGAARPILSKMYPKSSKLSFWFPSLFIGFTIISILLALFKGYEYVSFLLIYLLLIGIDSSAKNKSLVTGFYSIIATIVQFFGYGLGFLRSTLRLNVLGQSKEEVFPKMFVRV